MSEDNHTPLKRCNKCKNQKPLYEFHKSKSTKDGYRNICKQCRSIQEGHGYVPGDPEGFHICKACNRCLPHTEEFFHCSAGNRDGLANRCRECAIKLAHEWYENNTELGKQTRSIYAITHSQEAMMRVKQWQLNNPEQNKALIKVAKSRRRARERGLIAYLKGNDWLFALSYFDNRCAICGYLFDEKRIAAADHWKPLSKGGETIPSNILPLCHSTKGHKGGCNNSKAAKDPVKWLNERYDPVIAGEILSRITLFFQLTLTK